MTQHLVTRHTTSTSDGEQVPFGGNFTDPTLAGYLHELQAAGWSIVSTSVLHDGALLIFWASDAPTERPDLSHVGTYI